MVHEGLVAIPISLLPIKVIECVAYPGPRFLRHCGRWPRPFFQISPYLILSVLAVTPTLARGEFQEVIISLLSRPPAPSWTVCWQRCWSCSLCLSCALLSCGCMESFLTILPSWGWNWWWLVEGLLRWPRRWPEGSAHLCSMECYPLRFLLPVPDFCFLFSGFLRCHQLDRCSTLAISVFDVFSNLFLVTCKYSQTSYAFGRCVTKRIIELNKNLWRWNLILTIPAGLWIGKGLQDPRQKCLLCATSLCHV